MLSLLFRSRKKGDDQGISSWGWNLSGQHSTYHALFPRAWTIYDGITFLLPLINICNFCKSWLMVVALIRGARPGTKSVLPADIPIHTP